MRQKLLLFTLCLFAGINASAYDAEIDGIYYNLSEDEATVTYQKYQFDWEAPYSGLVDIPESVNYRGKTYRVTGIGDHAFYGSNLVSVTIPESVTSIDNAAFAFCSRLISVTIPASVTSISNDTFNRCTSLTSVTIPESVTSIGDYAFYSCKSLTSITIPERVSSIGIQVFLNCTSLSSMKVESGNTSYDSRNDCNAIIETASNTLIAGCQNTVVPNGVNSIGNSAFFGCSSLTSINIPEGVTSIDIEAFRGCVGLTSVTIPNSVTTIGVRAFGDCTGLTDVTAKMVTPPSIDSATFGSNTYKSATLHVPAGCVDYYKQTSGWKRFKTIVELAENKGDLNGDSKVDIADAVSILNLMAEGSDDSAADLNGDGKVDIADFVSVLNLMAEQ